MAVTVVLFVGFEDFVKEIIVAPRVVDQLRRLVRGPMSGGFGTTHVGDECNDQNDGDPMADVEDVRTQLLHRVAWLLGRPGPRDTTERRVEGAWDEERKARYQHDAGANLGNVWTEPLLLVSNASSNKDGAQAQQEIREYAAKDGGLQDVFQVALAR